MRPLIYLSSFIFAFSIAFSADVYESQASFNYEVTHIREHDTLRYDLNLKSNKSETNSDQTWTWTLNYSGIPGSNQNMIIKTLNFDPIIDFSSAFPVKENSKADFSNFKAFEISLPPLVDVNDLNKKILEPKIVIPIFNTTINTKILARPKKTTVKQTVIESNINKSDEPSYKSETKELEIDKTELADCTYKVEGQSKYKSNKGMLDVWVIKCECQELNESGNINKATYYYNLEFGFVYFDIELENERIEIRIKD